MLTPTTYTWSRNHCKIQPVHMYMMIQKTRTMNNYNMFRGCTYTPLATYHDDYGIGRGSVRQPISVALRYHRIVSICSPCISPPARCANTKRRTDGRRASLFRFRFRLNDVRDEKERKKNKKCSSFAAPPARCAHPLHPLPLRQRLGPLSRHRGADSTRTQRSGRARGQGGSLAPRWPR